MTRTTRGHVFFPSFFLFCLFRTQSPITSRSSKKRVKNFIFGFGYTICSQFSLLLPRCHVIYQLSSKTPTWKRCLVFELWIVLCSSFEMKFCYDYFFYKPVDYNIPLSYVLSKKNTLYAAPFCELISLSSTTSGWRLTIILTLVVGFCWDRVFLWGGNVGSHIVSQYKKWYCQPDFFPNEWSSTLGSFFWQVKIYMPLVQSREFGQVGYNRINLGLSCHPAKLSEMQAFDVLSNIHKIHTVQNTILFWVPESRHLDFGTTACLKIYLPLSNVLHLLFTSERYFRIDLCKCSVHGGKRCDHTFSDKFLCRLNYACTTNVTKKSLFLHGALAVFAITIVIHDKTRSTTTTTTTTTVFSWWRRLHNHHGKVVGFVSR